MKRSPFLGTWIAFAVAAALGAYIYFVESKREDKPGEKVKERVFAFDKSKVEGLSLAATGQQEVTLAREASGWRMTAPVAVAADAGEADSLVSSLETLESDASSPKHRPISRNTASRRRARRCACG